MRTLDVIQLVLWVLVGLSITWGIFYVWEYLRNAPTYTTKGFAKSAASFTFVAGVLWVILWVSAVIFNLFQIFGGITWHLI